MKMSMRNIKTVLVPIGAGTDGQTALAIAQIIAREVILVGIVPIVKNASISAGAQTARQVRKRLLSLTRSIHPLQIHRDRVRNALEGSPKCHCQREARSLIDRVGRRAGILRHSALRCSFQFPLQSCHCAWRQACQIGAGLIAVRGGPYAELAFQMGMGLHSAANGCAASCPDRRNE